MASSSSSSSSKSNIHHELDSVIGTATRIPRLLSSDGFTEWKYRFEQYAKVAKIWRSIQRGPREITYVMDNDAKTVAVKPVAAYTDEDFEIVEADERALALLTMALSPNIAQSFRHIKSAQELWDALIEVYEGNEDIKSSRKDMLNQKFNMFNYIVGETLDAQLQRFVTLVTEMKTANIQLSLSEINKKLLNALPKNWDMNVGMIKRTVQLARTTLTELISIIQACEIDDQQRALNHASSYNAAGVKSTTTAFSAQPDQTSYSPPQSSAYQTYVSTPPQKSAKANSTASSSGSPSVTISKEAEDNIALIAGFMNCYQALMSGNLAPPMSVTSDQSQIHPEDLEEMDITWQMGMAVHRAKEFVKKTGTNNWVKGKKVSFNKADLRCYNCHEKGHFARECTKPKQEDNQERALVPTSTTAAETPTNNKAMVVQQSGGFDWSDQMRALELNEGHAHLAQVADDAEAELKKLQNTFAFMASTSDAAEVNFETVIVSETCSTNCLKTLDTYRKLNSNLVREMDELKRTNFTVKKNEKNFLEKIEAQKKDISKLKQELSERACEYMDAKAKIVVLTTELETLKTRFENADFNFKKFDVSSTVVENMIANHTKWQDKKRDGLGYGDVPPPYNHNYSCVNVTQEEEDLSQIELMENSLFRKVVFLTVISQF